MTKASPPETRKSLTSHPPTRFIIFILLVISGFTFLGCSSANADGPLSNPRISVLYVTTFNEPLKKSPEPNSSTLSNLQNGTKVEITDGYDAKWVQVRAGSQTGWIFRDHLSSEVPKPKEDQRPRPPTNPRKPLPSPHANDAGPTAFCRDGTLSYSQHRSGTCSHHGGVAEWFNNFELSHRPPLAPNTGIDSLRFRTRLTWVSILQIPFPTARVLFMKKSVFVVAAIIENDKSEILCALRSSVMSLPGLWEFPGGKVQEDESEQDALRREINEELQCEIDVVERFQEVEHEYDTFNLQMVSYVCKVLNGVPAPTEHAQIVWLKREYLKSLVWAPADLPIVRCLMDSTES